MRETHCPVCATELEVRDVAPCFECGADPHELKELTAGKHSYAELRAFGEELVRCD